MVFQRCRQFGQKQDCVSTRTCVTNAFGKWHCGPFPKMHFDFARSYMGTHWMKEADGTLIHVTRKNERDALDFLSDRPKGVCLLINRQNRIHTTPAA